MRPRIRKRKRFSSRLAIWECQPSSTKHSKLQERLQSCWCAERRRRTVGVGRTYQAWCKGLLTRLLNKHDGAPTRELSTTTTCLTTVFRPRKRVRFCRDLVWTQALVIVRQAAQQVPSTGHCVWAWLTKQACPNQNSKVFVFGPPYSCPLDHFPAEERERSDGTDRPAVHVKTCDSQTG